MTITPSAFGGNSVNASSGVLNPGSLTSSAGDKIVVCYFWFDAGANSTSQTGSPVASTPSKTFTKATEFVGTTPTGIAVYEWVSDGTTLTQVTVTPTGASVNGLAGTTLKLASTAGTVTYDSATRGTGTDATTPLAWSAGGAITGTQVGIHMCTVDNGTNGTWTASSGYTSAFNNGNGASILPSITAYKAPETGTPSLSVAYTAAMTSAKELFVSFKEPAVTSLDPARRRRRQPYQYGLLVA